MPPQTVQGVPPGVTLSPVSGVPPGVTLSPVNSIDSPLQEGVTKDAQGRYGSVAPPSTMGLLWKATTNPAESGANPNSISGGLRQIGGRATAAIASPFLHPIDTLKSMVQTVGLPATNPDNPLFQRMQEFGTEWGKSKPLAIENAVGDALGMYEGGRVGEAAGAKILPPAAKIAGDIRQYVRPTPSSDIVASPEMASRTLAQSVLPATKDAAQFIKAAPLEVPNILDYAKRSNNPLNTQLEFSKAAEGSAKEARDFYENQMLKPNDKTVETTRSGFGRTSGEGPKTYASLSDIDKRVVQINKELDRPALNADDARRALASKTELQNEARQLTGILHSELSKATGVAPEDIANLRQRVGRSYELANDTNAAVTARMQGEGRTKLGELSTSKIPARILETIRGGPTAIADRAFQRSIRNFPGEPQPLPTLKPPAAEVASPNPGPRYPAIEAGQPPVNMITPDTDLAHQVMAERLGPRQRFQTEMQNAERDAEKAAENQRMQDAQDAARKRASNIASHGYLSPRFKTKLP